MITGMPEDATGDRLDVPQLEAADRGLKTALNDLCASVCARLDQMEDTLLREFRSFAGKTLGEQPCDRENLQ
jgi:hypothetical protein